VTPDPKRAHNERHRRPRSAVPLDIYGLVAALLAVFGALLLSGHEARREPPLGGSLPLVRIAGDIRPPANGVHRPRRAAQVPRPTHIRIPALGVSAPVVPLGLAKDRSMETPRRWGDTGWFEPGPEPGEVGAAVIAGHVDSKSGPAVFFRLRELRRGDSIVVDVAGGRSIRFRVQGVERWPKKSFPTRRVFGRTSFPALRLVTCSGEFDRARGHYVDNTIVYAKRV
jgi:LPXTG-site transpeptidase (sortase) family protein